MYLFYCDESGTYTKVEQINSLLNTDDEAKRWYFLGALAVKVEERKPIYDEVSKIKNKFFAPLAPSGRLHECSVEAEIKGHSLFAVINNGHPNY
jgi:hypothetical protein